MKLPHGDRARVDQEKIVQYLLNPAHPDNGGKAAFFLALGYNVNNWRLLAAAFQSLAANSDISKKLESPHGSKYILDGMIDAPVGKSTVVRTIWAIDRGSEIPRLVTAYPHPV